jgi:carboxyl-terminal processing protease
MYGYVRITHFNDATPRDLRRQLSDLQAAGPLHGLVLDLRGNPGGVLESAVGVADDFLDAGLIVRAEGRAAGSRFELKATAGDLLRDAPLVVLVDHGSASGSEIVAGALRDHGRATLMGERTFGKGSVQTVIPLRDGQALKLTTSRYFTPSGVSIHERGLEPDVVLAGVLRPGSPVTAQPGDDPAVQAALQYLRDRSLGTQVALAGEK